MVTLDRWRKIQDRMIDLWEKGVCVCVCMRACVCVREGRREGKGWLQVHTYIHYQSRFIEYIVLWSTELQRTVLTSNRSFFTREASGPKQGSSDLPGPCPEVAPAPSPWASQASCEKRGQLWAWRGRQMWLERHSRLFLLLCSAPGSPPLPSVHLSLPVCLLFLAFIHIHHLLPHSFHPSLRPPPRLPSHP